MIPMEGKAMDLIVATIVFIFVLVFEFIMNRRKVKLPIPIPKTLSKKAFIAFLFGFTAFIILTDRITDTGQRLVIIAVTALVFLAANINLPQERD
jgi:hypothetical protein